MIAHLGRFSWRMLVGGMLAVALVVFPFFNQAREVLLPYYKSATPNMTAWASLASVAREEATAEARTTGVRGAVDSVFLRLNGAEAIAVAEKDARVEPVDVGRSYLNLLWQAVPGLLRPTGWTPYYFDWTTKYVGFDPGNLTVIPVPAVVEAYLNFGWFGPPLVLAVVGALLAALDRAGRTSAAPTLGVALVVFSAVRLMNIEHYLFVACVAPMKLWMLAGFFLAAVAVIRRPWLLAR